MNYIQFIDTPELMGDTFQGESRQPMRTVLTAAYGLPLTDDQTSFFKKVAGGRNPPKKRVNALAIGIGRRNAKTETVMSVALYICAIEGSSERIQSRLSPGESAVVAVISPDRNQSKIAMQYAAGMVEQSPVLRSMVIRQDSECIEFSNRTRIEVNTASFRAVRGRTLLALILDECAFFRTDNSANPDVEIYRAAVPGLATLGGMVILISSPYAKRGLLYSMHQDHYGRDSTTLYIKGSTLDFNPTLDPQIIYDALRDDPEAAKSEWLGEFRSDLEAFISREVIESCTRTSPLELPYNNKFRYFGFADPAGGGQDEFTMAIGHHEGDVTIVDVVRGLKGTPSAIVAEYAQLFKAYKVSSIIGDRYAGSWPADEFKKHGITLNHSEKAKSDLYVDCLPMLNSGRVELPPDTILTNQLTNLERRTSRSGRDSIDHPSGGHDDRANAMAGLVATNAKRSRYTLANVS
ncbi:hypothetical protein [Zhongshania marina]|uniref:Terminase n=1 Tax=Zhongshania marina TaxID=2304603 RepID=A0A2S4HG63_9GAMM|nr:hypothetical protein [Marortus luteolus]POP52984.1 hypothetical protein C0068_07770 [Marortus luteolus]